MTGSDWFSPTSPCLQFFRRGTLKDRKATRQQEALKVRANTWKYPVHTKAYVLLQLEVSIPRVSHAFPYIPHVQPR